ncbi:hypothetical protein DXC69_02925 [Paenibacillus polymyxa]|nr:hypothetical protein DXC69_02925 [Paenibacillus polymyxa]
MSTEILEKSGIMELAIENETITKLPSVQWGLSRWHEMEHKSSSITIYSNGAFESNTVLFDDSRHRKYGNKVNFFLRFKNGNRLCDISSFSGNFSPDEEKVYPTSGMSDCIKNNFQLIQQGDVEVAMTWEAWKR